MAGGLPEGDAVARTAVSLGLGRQQLLGLAALRPLLSLEPVILVHIGLAQTCQQCLTMFDDMMVFQIFLLIIASFNKLVEAQLCLL